MGAERKKPSIPNVPPVKTPTSGRPSPPKRFRFGFQFWRQIEFFGLDQSKPKWFVSLLQKLSELSKEPIDKFLEDGNKRHTWRYHDINWTQTNIPVQRAHLTWIDADYLNNPDEYPLVQFQVSTALGRIVGFWDEEDVFQIVLLDPLHNIQPSKRFDYRVRRNSPLPCIYTCLLNDVNYAKTKPCAQPGCDLHKAVTKLPRADHEYDVTVLMLQAGDHETIEQLVKDGKATCVEDIVTIGMLTLMSDYKAHSDPAPQ